MKFEACRVDLRAFDTSCPMTLNELVGLEKWNNDLPDPVRAVYVLFEEDGGSPLYVGQSGHLRARLEQHRKDGKIFKDVYVYPVEDKEDRLRVETVLILLLRPTKNKGIHLGVNKDKIWELKWALANQRKTTTKKSTRGRKNRQAEKDS